MSWPRKRYGVSAKTSSTNKIQENEKKNMFRNFRLL
jgi:hypothetical protein